MSCGPSLIASSSKLLLALMSPPRPSLTVYSNLIVPLLLASGVYVQLPSLLVLNDPPNSGDGLSSLICSLSPSISEKP